MNSLPGWLILGVDTLFQLVLIDESIEGNIRRDALKLLGSLCDTNLVNEDEVSKFLELFQTLASKPAIRCDILICLSNMMTRSRKVETMFYTFNVTIPLTYI